jgi:dipeptidyl aminopeptidase/acylaminoacyl peptidase
MPELREVFEMVRNQTEPVPGAWEEQQRRQRRVVRNRKIGAISLSAALAVVAAWFVLSGSAATHQGKETNKVTGQPAMLPSERAIYLFDLETKQATRVTGIVPGMYPGLAVSPDGSMVAYAAGVEIHVANIDGTKSRTLEKTPSPGGAYAPQWSPDGSQIVYQAKGTANWVGDLFVVDVATGETTRLTHLEPVASALWDMAPTFSPDGQTVLFTRPSSNYVNQSWDLWSVPATGGRPRLVLRDAALGRLSPDGGTIAYFKPSPEDPLDGDIWLADADGTDARRLARGDLLAPRWSPDGTKIAYVDRGRGGTYVVDVTTGGTSRVLDGAYWPEWIDEQTWIVAPDPF